MNTADEDGDQDGEDEDDDDDGARMIFYFNCV